GSVNSRLTGKIQGIPSKLAQSLALDASIHKGLAVEFPARWNREFLGSNSESLIVQQRTTLASRKPLSSTSNDRPLVSSHSFARLNKVPRGLRRSAWRLVAGAPNQRCLHLDLALL